MTPAPWYLTPAALEAIDAPRETVEARDLLASNNRIGRVYAGEAVERLTAIWWAACQRARTPDIRTTPEAVLGAVHGHPETQFLAGSDWPAIAAEIAAARSAGITRRWNEAVASRLPELWRKQLGEVAA